MANKTLFTSTDRVGPLFPNLLNATEIAALLKSELLDLSSRRQEALFLNVGDSAVQNTTCHSPILPSAPPCAFLVIPVWNQIPQSEIQNLIEVFYKMGLHTPSKPLSSKANVLTSREQEVLQLLASGKSYKTIANSLLISLATVKFHMKNLYIKLNVGNKEDAIEWARHHLSKGL